MTHRESHIVDEYLVRAQMPEEENVQPAPTVRIKNESPSSTMPTLERTYDTPPALTRQKNKKVVRRKISPFSMVVLLFSIAIVVVFYISNILAVDHLMRQINAMQTKHQQLMNEQELLRARINKLSSFERIQQIARTQLGLTFPEEAPHVLDVDVVREKEAHEVLLRDVTKREE